MTIIIEFDDHCKKDMKNVRSLCWNGPGRSLIFWKILSDIDPCRSFSLTGILAINSINSLGWKYSQRQSTPTIRYLSEDVILKLIMSGSEVTPIW